LVGFQDIVGFLRDPAVATTIAILVVLATALAWLYRRFRKPKLEVSLEPVMLYPDPEYAIPEQSPRKFKSQTLRLKAKRRPIHQCKAKMSIDGESDYLLWDPKSPSEAKDLVPEEEVQLHVWQAVGMSENAWLYLNIRNRAQMDLKTLSHPVTVEISFLSEDGPLNKKPCRYTISGISWDTVSMVSLPA
jgi:hypothetical protein